MVSVMGLLLAITVNDGSVIYIRYDRVSQLNDNKINGGCTVLLDDENTLFAKSQCKSIAEKLDFIAQNRNGRVL